MARRVFPGIKCQRRQGDLAAIRKAHTELEGDLLKLLPELRAVLHGARTLQDRGLSTGWEGGGVKHSPPNAQAAPCAAERPGLGQADTASRASPTGLCTGQRPPCLEACPVLPPGSWSPTWVQLQPKPGLRAAKVMR